MAEDITRLALYESRAIVPIQTLTAGTHTFPMHTEGNSLLSTVYVKTITGSVDVKYWDFGPGGAENLGERVDLQFHDPITVADTSSRIIVTALHNKPRLEIIVTGGPVEVGVYVTVVSTFASDLDTHLKKHLQDADLLKDKGVVAVGYDAVLDKFFFLPIEGGAVKVTGTVIASSFTGTPMALRSADGLTVPVSTTIDAIVEATVPVGKTWQILRLQGHCRAYGYFEVFVDSTKLSGIRLNSGPSSENPLHKFEPYHALAAGKKIKVKYTHSFGPSVDVGAIIYFTES